MSFTVNPTTGMLETGQEAGSASVAIRNNFRELARRAPNCNYLAQVDPGNANNTTQGYKPGSLWLNTNSGVMFYCTASTGTTATWVHYSTGGNTFNQSLNTTDSPTFAAVTTTTANLTDATNKRLVTDAQRTVLGNTSGTNTGDQDLSAFLLADGSRPMSGSLDMDGRDINNVGQSYASYFHGDGNDVHNVIAVAVNFIGSGTSMQSDGAGDISLYASYGTGTISLYAGTNNFNAAQINLNDGSGSGGNILSLDHGNIYHVNAIYTDNGITPYGVGPQGIQGPAGADGLGFVFRDGWDGSQSYQVNDVVTWQGTTYVCTIAGSSSTSPDNLSGWQLFVSKGDTGATGPAGADGADSTVPGPAGSNGADGNTVTLSQCLSNGSDAGGQSITGLPSITFADMTSQSTAATTPTLGTVLSVGNDASGYSIVDLNGLASNGTLSLEAVSGISFQNGSGVEVASMNNVGNFSATYLTTTNGMNLSGGDLTIDNQVIHVSTSSADAYFAQLSGTWNGISGNPFVFQSSGCVVFAAPLNTPRFLIKADGSTNLLGNVLNLNDGSGGGASTLNMDAGTLAMSGGQITNADSIGLNSSSSPIGVDMNSKAIANAMSINFLASGTAPTGPGLYVESGVNLVFVDVNGAQYNVNLTPI